MIKKILAVMLIVPSMRAMVDEDGQKTQLIAAIKENNSERVQELLDQGVDVNALCNHLIVGLTPLKCAARYGATAIAQLLLKAGAQINGPHDKTIGSGAALHYACEYGHEEMVEFLLDNKADLNARNWHKQIPLSCAAANGRLDFVRFLVGKGALVDPGANRAYSQNSCGPYSFVLTGHSSPLVSAVRLYHDEMAQFLIEHGADVNHMYSDKTLLELAYELGDNRMVQLLKKVGATLPDLTTIPQVQPNLLLEAAKKGFSYKVKVLILAGSDLEEVCEKERATALIWAADKGYTEVCELLLEAGANAYAKNKDGKTALVCAWEKEHTETAAFIKEFVKEPLLLKQLCVNTLRRLYKERALSEEGVAVIPSEYEFDRVMVRSD